MSKVESLAPMRRVELVAMADDWARMAAAFKD
jgi:hypothetical protein